MNIKICGITNYEDAKAAVKLGVDMLGFIFYKKSPRYIKPEDARDIIKQLPDNIESVGVFVNEDYHELKKAKEIAGFETYQLHGDETPEFCSGLKGNYIKAIRIKNNIDIINSLLFDTNKLLFDTFAEGEFGGTGKIFNWKLLSKTELDDKFVILSGGLTPENVSEAILTAKPDAVDVSSGVEKKPGIKDHNKIKLFIEAVKNATEI